MRSSFAGSATPLTRVAVVEDHPLFREGLAGAINGLDGITAVAAVSSVEELEGRRLGIDVVLLDLNLPGLSGGAAVARCTANSWRVLVISASTTEGPVLDALAEGASGYLGKEADRLQIRQAIVTVAAGGAYVSPTLASYLLKATRSPQPIRLTGREREILSLLAQGERDEDIAEELYISVGTVRSHLDRIREKTGRRRRPDLTRLAVEQGLLSCRGG